MQKVYTILTTFGIPYNCTDIHRESHHLANNTTTSLQRTTTNTMAPNLLQSPKHTQYVEMFLHPAKHWIHTYGDASAADIIELARNNFTSSYFRCVSVCGRLIVCWGSSERDALSVCHCLLLFLSVSTSVGIIPSSYK